MMSLHTRASHLPREYFSLNTGSISAEVSIHAEERSTEYLYRETEMALQDDFH